MAALLIIGPLVCPQTASAEVLSPPEEDARPSLTGWFTAAEIHGSLLSDVVERSMMALTFGWALQGGHRWNGWGVFLHLEQNAWVATETTTNVEPGAFNIGVGVEYVYARGFVHTALSLGPSVLLFDTTLDKAGSVGLFLDLRPVGLRFQVHDLVVIRFDPLSFAIVAPVLGGIPLAQLEYRTTISVEIAP